MAYDDPNVPPEHLNGHEVTHYFANTQAYKTLQTSVVDKLKGDRINKLRADKMKTYNGAIKRKIANILKNNPNISNESLNAIITDYVDEEIVADISGGMNEYSDMFAEEVEQFRKAVTGDVETTNAKTPSTESKSNYSAEDYAESIDGGGESNDAKFSLVGKNENGIEVYETSDEIKQLSYDDRIKVFISLMTNEYRGRTAKFTRNNISYYAQFDTKGLNKNIYGDNKSDKNGWKSKINIGAEGNIFELVENSDYSGSSYEKAGKKSTAHQGVKDWDYYVKTVQIDNRVYDVLANVRKKQNGEYVYSITLRENKKIRVTPPIGIISSLKSGVHHSNNNVSQKDTSVNTHSMQNSEKDAQNNGENVGGNDEVRFSMSKPVEQTKNLIAVHNIGSGSIDSALELGGLAMPSFAINKATKLHKGYGDVSVVAYRDSIDPEKNSKNKIFAGDAWTPTFPEIGYKIDRNENKKLINKLTKILGEDESLVHLVSLVREDNMLDRIKRADGDFVKAFKNEIGMKFAFLKDIGVDISVPKTVPYNNFGFTASDYNSFIDYIDYIPDESSDIMRKEPQIRKFLYDRTYNNALQFGEKVAKIKADMLFGKEMSFASLDSLLDSARQYKNNKKTIDDKKFYDEVEKNMDGREERFLSWLSEIGKTQIEKKGVRNNKDPFTPSGNRRSFESLYYDFTLDNIVKAMRSQPEQGRSQAFSSPSSLRGAMFDKISTISDVKKKQDRISEVELEDVEGKYDEFNNEVERVISKFDDDLFTACDIALDFVQNGKTKNAMARFIKSEYGFKDWSDKEIIQIVNDMFELKEKANKLPVEYFEAKVYRAFPLSEAAGVVVPDTVSSETISKLEDAGANVLTYETGNQQDRLEKVNSIPEIRFSASNSSKITKEDVEAIQSIKNADGTPKSVNDFTSEDIKKAEPFARQYFKEMGVKSPFFRAWFGDWRVEDNTPIHIVTEKGSDRGKIKNNDTGWEINVSGKVFEESRHNAIGNKTAIPYLDYINSIVENAVLLDSYAISLDKAKSENSAMMHSLYAIANIGNGNELLKLYVEELNDVNSDGTIKRSYQLQNITNQQHGVRGSENYLSPITHTADIKTISDLFNLVKQYDKKFNPKPASKVVNEDGTPKVVYHGTGRSDRVGNVFLPERATSGPMAFFTDNKKVAENYAKDKIDTSIAYDSNYDDYYSQFRVNRNGESVSVVDLWNKLSPKEKQVIRENAKHITFDDEAENIIFDFNANYGVGGFDDYRINQAGGNYIKALVDEWLFAGNLYGDEEQFNKVLSLVGVNNVEYFNPNKRQEGIYAVYLNIINPFDSLENLTENFIDKFRKWAEGKTYISESKSADLWDKNNISAEIFAERLNNDLKNGTTHSFTSIPDIFTDFLKELKYDGIKDVGGKSGGEGHTVYIPFTSNQIKSATDNIGTYDGSNNNIRFSASKKSYAEQFETQDLIRMIADDIGYHEGLIEASKKNKEEFVALVKSNESLTKRLESAKAEMKRTKVPKTNNYSVLKHAKSIIDYMGSKASSREIGEKAAAIYNQYYKEMKESGGVQGLQEKALANMAGQFQDLAVEILNQAEEYPDGDDYIQLRAYLKNQAIKFPDYLKSDVEYKEFRKAHFGTIKLANNGLAIDSVYQELSTMFPRLFNQSKYTNPADQLQHIADVLDRLKPKPYNPYEMYMDEAVEEVVNQFVAGVDTVMQGPTKADKLAMEANEALEKQRAKFEKKYQELKDETKKRQQNQKRNRNERARKANLKVSIRKTFNDLNSRLIHPTDSKKVPVGLMKSIAEVCKAVDFSTDRTGADGQPTKARLYLDSLKRRYDDIQNDKDYDIASEFDETLSGKLNELCEVVGDKRVIDLNTDELAALDDILKQIKHQVINANKQLAIDEALTNREIGQEIYENLAFLKLLLCY